jgi:hypothetical protein
LSPNSSLTKSPFKPDPNDTSTAITMSSTVSWIKGFIGEDDNSTEPLTAIYYPILSEAIDEVSVADFDSSNTKLVGIIAM